MKRDFLLGGTKLPTGGAVRGAGGAMSPPVFMLKEALHRPFYYFGVNFHITCEIWKHPLLIAIHHSFLLAVIIRPFMFVTVSGVGLNTVVSLFFLFFVTTT